MVYQELKELKDKANTYFNEEVESFTYPERNCIKIAFISSEYAEQFINENKNIKYRGELLFSNIEFEQDNNAVYLSYKGNKNAIR